MFGYFAFEGLEKELIHDLKGKYVQKGRLFLSEKQIETPWSQISFSDFQSQSVESISKTAAFLKNQKEISRWYPYAYQLHRRTQLVSEQLKKPTEIKINFLEKLKAQKFGHWLFGDEKEILYAKESNHPLPWGEVNFNEDKDAPSRAYMKLWEGFTLYVDPPKRKDIVVDMGSSPGGWVWVLKNLGCEVYSVDRSDLRNDLMKDKNIHHRKSDVFKLKPSDLPDLDWFFSDVICYPDKLYEWIKIWLEHPKCKNFFVTIKFQGKTDFETLKKFQEIPNSKIVHLYNNKHELTWIHQR